MAFSGKSSVLEAFSGLPFARDSGLCTRFATQIAMRHALVQSITVSIIAAKGTAASDPTAIKKFSDFKKQGLTSLTGESFSKIFQEVHFSILGFIKCN